MFTVEKTREVNLTVVNGILEAAVTLGEPRGFKAALVAYGVRALPIVEPTSNWAVIQRAYDELPLLGKSPNLAEALKETLELVRDTEPPLEPAQTIVVWSAAVRPGREADLLVKALESIGVKVDIVVTRPSPPGWIKYNPVVAEKIVTVRSNTNLTRLYEKLVTVHPRAV